MAILPDFVHNNPNASSAVVGAAVAAVDILVFEEANPVMTLAKAAGATLLTRGLIHLDSDSEVRTITNEYVQIAASRNPKAGTVTFTGSATVDESMAPAVLAAVEEGAAKASAKAKAKKAAA